MVEAKCTLYRLDFCADLTAVQAPVFNLGFMLEAAVSDGARWLGLTSRVSLTRVELDHVNVHTWPELADLDAYMDKLFDRAWDRVVDRPAEDLVLGASLLAQSFSPMSALTFGKLDVPANLLGALDLDANEWQKQFYSAITDMGDQLKPALTASILNFEAATEARPLVDARPKLRLEAA